MKRTCYIVIAISLLSGTLSSQSPNSKTLDPAFRQTPTAVAPYRTLLNINNISMWVQNDGVNSYSPFPSGSGWGLVYRQAKAGLVYSDDLIWVGLVRDGRSPVLRSGGGLWQAGTTRGTIISKGVPEDTNSSSARIFRIRRDYNTADLRRDASEFNNVPLTSVTNQQIEAIRTQYRMDWSEWPVSKGSPIDTWDNSLTPGVQNADQVIWYAYNDLDSVATYEHNGTPPIGLEVQVTFWAYRGVPEFDNVVFKRYRIIYKGTSTTSDNSRIDSLYFCQWADPDIGYFADDLAGCDSSLNLGFAYNGGTPDRLFEPFDKRTPAIGYTMLQGPIVASSSSAQALYDFQSRSGFVNLPMSSFLVKHVGLWWNEGGSQSIPSFWWNVVRGTKPINQVSNESWLDPWGQKTKFIFSGDPANRTGWLDGSEEHSKNLIVFAYPGEKRLMQNTGPLTLALGDTQEIVTAIVVGEGFDGPQSVGVVKYSTKIVRGIYPALAEWAQEAKAVTVPIQPPAVPKEFSLSQNYPNPFNPSTRIEYTLPIERDVHLAIYNVLGQEVRVLDAGLRQAGKFFLEWDGRDATGRLLPTGIYVYRLEAGSVDLKKKMLILR